MYTHGSVTNLSGWIWEEAELENEDGFFLQPWMVGVSTSLLLKGTLVEQARILMGESLEVVYFQKVRGDGLERSRGTLRPVRDSGSMETDTSIALMQWL